MRRSGVWLVAGFLSAAIVSAEAGGESQRLDSGPAPKYESSEGGWWQSFRPAPTKPNVRARPAGENRAPARNASDDGVKAEPAAKPRTTKKQTQSTRRSGSKAATAKAPAPKRSSEEARWWEETGNPAVFAFSGCVADHAEATTREGTELPHAEYVTTAMAGPCKEPFDRMAGLILERHGEQGFAKVSRELIESTFIPSVRNAIETAHADMRSQEKRKAALGVEVQQAKDAMFACFVRETDRLAAISDASDRSVGESVIATCSGEANRFFVKLDELYPDASGGAQATQQTAISSSYLPAILTRVASVRAQSRESQ